MKFRAKFVVEIGVTLFLSGKVSVWLLFGDGADYVTCTFELWLRLVYCCKVMWLGPLFRYAKIVYRHILLSVSLCGRFISILGASFVDCHFLRNFLYSFFLPLPLSPHFHSFAYLNFFVLLFILFTYIVGSVELIRCMKNIHHFPIFGSVCS